MSLYVYGRDEPGKSNCNQSCAKAWPPLVATEEAGVSSDWSVIAREDGVKQWAFKGQPLYAYAKDPTPGTSFGDNVGDVWHVAAQDMWTPPEIAIGPSLAGRVLVDAKGMTLYINERDQIRDSQTADVSGKTGATPILNAACTKHCRDAWQPLVAPAVGLPHGEWSVVRRDDGELQWAFRGKALYTYVNDLAPTDTLGDGRDQVWRAVVVEPTPPRPAWVTFQASDAGELLADTAGFTIYAFNFDQNQPRHSTLSAPATCDSECIHTYWRPVLAAAGSEPIGNWSIVKNDDGAAQWAYMGQPLYTHTRDKTPGDITGTRFTGSKAWHPIMRNGQHMQGQGGN
jgi:predicted lipoprotein with Yx(FWY)xxD motif